MTLNREMRRWHWISAALCLAAVLLFSISGVTLNHADSIAATPVIKTLSAQLPPALLRSLGSTATTDAQQLPQPLIAWIDQQLHVNAADQSAEWSDDEIYLSIPAPGTDAWLTVDRVTGEVRYEHTNRGWIAFFNDVHKGRHTGVAWRVFIDAVAVACVVFSLSGLVLLQLGAKQRKSTWPLIGAGIALLVLLLASQAHAAQLDVTLEIPQQNVAEYHRPYLAVWVEREDQTVAAHLAVWYETGSRDGTRWLSELRQWWRRGGREQQFPIDGVTGATRPIGQHQLRFVAGVAPLGALLPGRYVLAVEAARESGGREILRLPFEWPVKAQQHVAAQGKAELGAVVLEVLP
jgi:uncharacterized protein